MEPDHRSGNDTFHFLEFSCTRVVKAPFCTDAFTVALAVSESLIGFGEGKVFFRVTRDVIASCLDISDSLLLPKIHPM